MVSLIELIEFSPRFQRAVHVRYDLGNRETIERYIPTPNAAHALHAILKGTSPRATQRAHVLYAAYGSGKSLFAIYLAALLENRLGDTKHNERLLQRLSEISGELAQAVQHYQHENQRLLPVVLSGDEGSFNQAMLRALGRSLHEAKLAHLQPTTRFATARQTLESWKTLYPNAFMSFDDIVSREHNQPAEQLMALLDEQDEQAFNLFLKVYPRLTAGAQFNVMSSDAAHRIYSDIVVQLKAEGYQGIVVIWDEFGRYLENRVAQAFGTEAALLQEFAETCNYSGDLPLHLILLTHKELQSYAHNLSKNYQQEWSRIEGRFQKHDLNSDPHVAYCLMQSSLSYPQPQTIEQLISDSLETLSQQALDYGLFPGMEYQAIRRLIQRTYPLHPLSVFALVRLSSKVSQNERTMFTFLTADEPLALQSLVRNLNAEQSAWVGLDALWDYFEDAIRADNGLGGAHRIWLGVAHALDKVTPDDLQARAIIKAIGVLLICNDATRVRPQTELLAWGSGQDLNDARDILSNLRRRKAIIERKIDGYWTFTSGSDIDFERKQSELLDRANPSPLQLRRLLEKVIPPPPTLARRYNQEYAITRYFNGLYAWPDELDGMPWQELIQQKGGDGLVVYVLMTEAHEEQTIRQAVSSEERVIFAYPAEPLSQLHELLREVFAWQELGNAPELKQHEDRERIRRELEWLLEDASQRLEREVSRLLNPRQGKTRWITVKGTLIEIYEVSHSNHPSSIVSDICKAVFPSTPRLNSEGLNKQSPTGQQVRAAEKLIDAILTSSDLPRLGLQGHGPEVLALNSLLATTQIIRKQGEAWVFGKPSSSDPACLLDVWEEIQCFFENCRSGPRSFRAIVDTLIRPPYGLRLGVLPVLLAAVLREHLRTTTIRHNKRVVSPMNGELFTQIIARPDAYSLEIGDWREQDERLWQALTRCFGSHILPSEVHYQPLALLPIMLVRWLQNQSHYCRQTHTLPAEALAFRDLIRQAQTEPARVFFHDLPQLLQVQSDTSEDELFARLSSLASAISSAYLDLQRRLDNFTVQEFGVVGANVAGHLALKIWLDQVVPPERLEALRFGSLPTQAFVEVIRSSDQEGTFWDTLSRAVLGVPLRDWTDQSEARLYDTLSRGRQEVERESQQLIEEERVVAITLALPDAQPREYRFRSSDLSAQGKRLLQNFRSTLEIAGRPLSADERRQIAVAFLAYVMGEDLEQR
ncbi:MAG: hypothetical protein NZ750_11360 [Anaerolineae bacterium]|nr:hypothetical protein [Anaerolineae bacterium]MDW8172086.1 hypothetical protein [Anaerolineae bacterium]